MQDILVALAVSVAGSVAASYIFQRSTLSHSSSRLRSFRCPFCLAKQAWGRKALAEQRQIASSQPKEKPGR